ncbi:unnamed protein product [marine sediment metagenome]|uniref:Uncharacterized protein n=1 Tax=marine sediment metagenome TaxID=412755 RepID=X1HU54_9ZZZZ
MRTKDQILNDISEFQAKYPVWGGIQSLHDQLTIELLIDIRDILCHLYQALTSVEKMARHSR